MKITFGQDDITKAMHAYILSQGINLEGKHVEIDFTQTRGGKSGPMALMANVSIENSIQLPDPAYAQPQRPQLSVAVDNVKAPASEPEVQLEVPANTSDAEAPAKPTSSLFN